MINLDQSLRTGIAMKLSGAPASVVLAGRAKATRRSLASSSAIIFLICSRRRTSVTLKERAQSPLRMVLHRSPRKPAEMAMCA
jgi:hypothetical protein